MKRPWDAARAYAESKLHVVALAFALSRRWPQVLSNVVDRGCARTRMGGPGAPVDLHTGQRTQAWLAVSDEPAALVADATGIISGRSSRPARPAIQSFRTSSSRN